MSRLLRNRLLPLRLRQPEDSDSDTNTSSDNDDSDDYHDYSDGTTSRATTPIGPEPYYPSLTDVLKTRYILQYKVRRGIGLPGEMVDLIVDMAEYWASAETRMGKKKGIGQDGDRSFVRTRPLCYDESLKHSSSVKLLPHRTAHPCRKIIFQILSHDQGWANAPRGGYAGSWSWFDAVVIRSAHEKIRALADDNNNNNNIEDQLEQPEQLPPTNYDRVHPQMLQANRVATRPANPYTIIWHYQDDIPAESEEAGEIQTREGRGRDTLDGRTVRELEVGDAISVWARARFPGWANYADWLSIRVFWAV